MFQVDLPIAQGDNTSIDSIPYSYDLLIPFMYSIYDYMIIFLGK